MKLYTYICTVGGEDEYLIAKDDQIVPEAGAHEDRTEEELTEETFMNAFSKASLQGAIYLFMTAWDNRIYKDFRAANVSKEFQTDMRKCVEAWSMRDQPNMHNKWAEMVQETYDKWVKLADRRD